MTAQKRILEWCDRLEIALSNLEFPDKTHRKGKYKTIEEEDHAKIFAMRRADVSIHKIAKDLGLSYSTLQKFLSIEKKKALAPAATEYKSTQI